MITHDTLLKLIQEVGVNITPLDLSGMPVDQLNDLITKVRKAELCLEMDSTVEEMKAAIALLISAGRLSKDGSYSEVPELSYEYIKTRFKSVYGK